MPRSMFETCTNLKSIYLPTSISEYHNYEWGLTRLWNRGFANCRSLENIALAKNITMLGREIFRGCSGRCSSIKEIYTPLHPQKRKSIKPH